MSFEDKGRELPFVALLYAELPTSTGAGERSVESSTDNLSESSDNIFREIPLSKGATLRVGRAKSNDVQIFDANVSRFHAVFSASEFGVVLSDLSSFNGTQVNGRRISVPFDLSSGDVVEIGKAKIRVLINVGENDETDFTGLRTQAAQLTTGVATVLVADVCGYTKLSELLPAHDVAAALDVWFERVTEAIGKCRGEVDKYLGDCVMALWKSPEEEADVQAVNAAKVASEIIGLTQEFSASSEWKYHEQFPWCCRVALNTGPVLMGAVGVAGARDFTVLGDTVNVAFRIEGLAGKLEKELVFSAATAGRIQSVFSLSSLGCFDVEGRSEQVEIFTVNET